MAEKWIQKTDIDQPGHKGKFTKYCIKQGFNGPTEECIRYALKQKGETFEGSSVPKMALLARTLKRLK